MEAAAQALALVGGREDVLWDALAAAAAALLPPNDGDVGGGDMQPVVYCHVVLNAVAGMEQRLGAVGRTRRVFALENAVMRLAAAASATSTSQEDTARLPSSDRRFFRSVFVRVMEHFLALTAPSTDARRHAILTITRLGILLASLWLVDNRRANLGKATELLQASTALLQKRRDVEHLAAGPLFVLAMTSLVEAGDKPKALELFRSAAAVAELRDSHAEAVLTSRGVFSYWFAVALFQNGLVEEAAATLKRCVRANYEPVACLALAALLHLRELDFREAADELQRAMETDFAQSVSMFDYAVLLGRMGNFEGQLQMLEYFCENSRVNESASGSGKKRQRDESLAFGSASPRAAPLSTILDDRKLNDLIPSPLSRTSTRMVQLHLALATMENGNWLESKRYFEEFFADEDGRSSTSDEPWSDEYDVTRDYIYVLLQSHHFMLALSRADAFLSRKGSESHALSDSSAASLALIHLYKADALLSLERVATCHKYLLDVVAPLLTVLLSSASSTNSNRGLRAGWEEIVRCHTQLLNNLAVVTVCQKGVDEGIVLLRRALTEYPDSLLLKFNLVLLLWRTTQKEAACTLWIEARGWNLQMKMEDLPDEKELRHALALAAASEQASDALRTTLISEHVSDLQGDCGVSEQQLVHLDALVLGHWRKVRSAKAVENSLLYVQYLETIAKDAA